MKIAKLFIALLSITFGIITVRAKEVDVKYEYVSDSSVISNKIMSKETTIEIDNITIQIIDSKEKNKGNNIKIIPITEDNQLSWLNKLIKDNELVKAYYFIFEDNNNNQINPDNLKISLNNNQSNYVIYTINNEGNIIDVSSNDNNSIKLLNNNYFVIAINSDVKTINYQANNGGVIILDGKIISNSGNYNFCSDKIVIRTDSGYKLVTAILNNKDILAEINNGFLDISQVKEDLNLNLKFNKIDEQNTNNNYIFSGQVIYNGKPLSNAYIELHSNILTTTTDKLGNFHFENVSLGSHSITISHDDKVIGYSEFSINEKEDNSIELVYKNNEKITSNSNEVDLTVYINDNYDMTFKKNSNKSNNQIETNNHNYLLVLSIILLILIIIYLIYKKNKDKEK